MKTLLVCTLLSIFAFISEARYFRAAHGHGKLGGVWANPAHWMKKHHLVGMAHHSAYDDEPAKLSKTKEKIQRIVAGIVAQYKTDMENHIESFTSITKGGNPLDPIPFCADTDLKIKDRGKLKEFYKLRLGYGSEPNQRLAMTSTLWDQTYDVNPLAIKKPNDGIFGNLVDEFDTTGDGTTTDVKEQDSLCGMNNCFGTSIVGNLADHIRGKGYHVRHDDICQGKFSGDKALRESPQCNLAPQEGKLSYYCGVKCKDVNLEENFLGHTCYDAADAENVFSQSNLEKNCKQECNGIPTDNVILPGGAACPIYCDYNPDKQRWEPDFESSGSRITNLVEGCNLGYSSSDCISHEAPHCHRTITYDVATQEWGTKPDVNRTQDCSDISDPHEVTEITWSNSKLDEVKLSVSGRANATDDELCIPYNPRKGQINGGNVAFNYLVGQVGKDPDNTGPLSGPSTTVSILQPSADMPKPQDYASEELWQTAVDAYDRAWRDNRDKAKLACENTVNAEGQSAKWEEFYSEFVKPNAGNNVNNVKGGENGLGEVCTYIEDLSIPASQYVCERADPTDGCVVYGLKQTGCGSNGQSPCTCDHLLDQNGASPNIDCVRNVTVMNAAGQSEIIEQDCFCAKFCKRQFGAAEPVCEIFFAPGAIVKNRRDELRREVSYSVAEPEEFKSMEFPLLRFTSGAFKSNIDEKGYKSSTGESCVSGTVDCIEDNDFCDPASSDGNFYGQHSCKKSTGCQTFRSIILALNGNAQLKKLRGDEKFASRKWWDLTIEETRNDLSRIAAFAKGLAGFSDMLPHLGGNSQIPGDVKNWDEQIREGCGTFKQWTSGERGEQNAGMCGPSTMDYDTWSTARKDDNDRQYYGREKAQSLRLNCLCRGKEEYDGIKGKGFGDTAFLATTKEACLASIDLQQEQNGKVQHASTERWCSLDELGKDWGYWLQSLNGLLPDITLWSNTIPTNRTVILHDSLVESIGQLDTEISAHPVTGAGGQVGYVYSRNRQDCGRITNAINGLHFHEEGSDVIKKSNIGGNCVPIKNLEKVLYHLEFELMADKRIATAYDAVVEQSNGGTGKPTFTSRMCETGSEGDLSYRQIVFDWKEARCGSICAAESESTNLASPEPESNPNDEQYKTPITDSYASMCYIDLNQLMSGGSEILIAGKAMPDPLDYRDDEIDEAVDQAITAVLNDKTVDNERDVLFQSLRKQFEATGATLATYIGSQAGEHWLRVMQHVTGRGVHSGLSPDDPTYEKTDKESYGSGGDRDPSAFDQTDNPTGIHYPDSAAEQQAAAQYAQDHP